MKLWAKLLLFFRGSVSRQLTRVMDGENDNKQFCYLGANMVYVPSSILYQLILTDGWTNYSPQNLLYFVSTQHGVGWCTMDVLCVCSTSMTLPPESKGLQKCIIYFSNKQDLDTRCNHWPLLLPSPSSLKFFTREGTTDVATEGLVCVVSNNVSVIIWQFRLDISIICYQNCMK